MAVKFYILSILPRPDHQAMDDIQHSNQSEKKQSVENFNRRRRFNFSTRFPDDSGSCLGGSEKWSHRFFSRGGRKNRGSASDLRSIRNRNPDWKRFIRAIENLLSRLRTPLFLLRGSMTTIFYDGRGFDSTKPKGCLWINAAKSYSRHLSWLESVLQGVDRFEC